jgi:hypothetical protein
LAKLLKLGTSHLVSQCLGHFSRISLLSKERTVLTDEPHPVARSVLRSNLASKFTNGVIARADCLQGVPPQTLNCRNRLHGVTARGKPVRACSWSRPCQIPRSGEDRGSSRAYGLSTFEPIDFLLWQIGIPCRVVDELPPLRRHHSCQRRGEFKEEPQAASLLPSIFLSVQAGLDLCEVIAL